MEINIYDLTSPLADDLLAYATERLGRLETHTLPITGAEVEFYHSASERTLPAKQLVKVILHLDPPHAPEMRAHSYAFDAKKALDLALTHLQQQLLHLEDGAIPPI
jgi:ribosome-associated translation inhibitor RaiA